MPNDSPPLAALSFERPRWVTEELAEATGRGVRVAVIDSGRDPFWKERRVRPGVGLVASEGFELSFSDDDRDRVGHGTACCDLILGLAPRVEILPVRVFGDRLETSPELLVAGIEWAVQEEVHIINLSLGTFLERAIRPLYQACEHARQAGIVVVSAVHTVEDWSYPAVFENVLGVQAGRFTNVFEFEFRPDEAAEVLAQGERRVRWLGGAEKEGFGSSFAAPHVSALVALLLERFPGASLEELRRHLERFARGTGSPSS